MISKLQAQLQRGSRHINMKMHPPELGRVQLSLVSEDNGLQAHLQVQNSQVQSILERNMAALRQALEQQNLDLDQIRVSVESGGDGREEHGSGERDFRATDRRSGGHLLSEPEDREEQIGGYVRSPSRNSGISLRV
jgi:flagellar hook-length control protein FliK